MACVAQEPKYKSCQWRHEPGTYLADPIADEDGKVPALILSQAKKLCMETPACGG